MKDNYSSNKVVRCGSQTLVLLEDSNNQLKCECRVCGQEVVIDKHRYSTREFEKFYGYLGIGATK